MDVKKMIGGRQFWSLIAGLAILLGILLIVGHPKEQSAPTASPPPPEDDVKVLVLNYHMVNSRFLSLAVEPEDFDWQMKYLVDHGYHTITPNELYDYLAGNGTLPERPVLITFDDGYVDNYTKAFPILKKYHLKATVFVVTGFLSKRKGYLTWDQVREMEKNGVTRRVSLDILLSSLPIRRGRMICILQNSRRRRGIRRALRSSTAMWTATATSMPLNAYRSSVRARRTRTSLIVCTIHRILPSMAGYGTEYKRKEVPHHGTSFRLYFLQYFTQNPWDKRCAAGRGDAICRILCHFCSILGGDADVCHT